MAKSKIQRCEAFALWFNEYQLYYLHASIVLERLLANFQIDYFIGRNGGSRLVCVVFIGNNREAVYWGGSLTSKLRGIFPEYANSNHMHVYFLSDNFYPLELTEKNELYDRNWRTSLTDILDVYVEQSYTNLTNSEISAISPLNQFVTYYPNQTHLAKDFIRLHSYCATGKISKTVMPHKKAQEDLLDFPLSNQEPPLQSNTALDPISPADALADAEDVENLDTEHQSIREEHKEGDMLARSTMSCLRLFIHTNSNFEEMIREMLLKNENLSEDASRVRDAIGRNILRIGLSEIRTLHEIWWKDK